MDSEFSQFTDRLRTLAETVQTYYGGGYANIAILGLVMYWLIRSQPRELDFNNLRCNLLHLLTFL